MSSCSKGKAQNCRCLTKSKNSILLNVLSALERTDSRRVASQVGLLHLQNGRQGTRSPLKRTGDQVRTMANALVSWGLSHDPASLFTESIPAGSYVGRNSQTANCLENCSLCEISSEEIPARPYAKAQGFQILIRRLRAVNQQLEKLFLGTS